MKDTWCRPVNDGEKMVYGGAARNVRIARNGGMDQIIDRAMRTYAAEVEANVDASNHKADNVVPIRRQRKIRKRPAA
ncbi:hypothetical protein ACR3H8_19700 [Pseudomonas aeruginosa]|uniref:hypothetical protein n=1 Tax=Pseudomonas aeruginosa group TaxID=136841 RepID=UPI000F51E64F|nr:hypothetical protein [Pseudomonas aeruginosa]EIU2716184.1 hypothetical protein [Pseudomonas aeruginosa]EIU2863003.1 hypothetical protein [Pseudomonas aeruginosa]ELD5773034.1 hypothetical protein [Pseudomonas aeruginosa]MBA5210071.1 hypothetical protein [Pseudomonas aeruginosa]MBG3917475.1 hypothetical protein [Pseudomonas aeruginosa]